MRLNRSFWIVPAGLLLLGLVYSVARRSPGQAPAKPPAVIVPKERTPDPLPPAAVPRPPPPSDPLLRRWQESILDRDAAGVREAQGAFREREGEYREPLVKLAAENLDPRVRAFTVTLLGGFQAPPPEAFFVDRLTDASEFPRESALAALERIGTAACLPAVERAAASDPVERLRTAAERTARAVRAR